MLMAVDSLAPPMKRKQTAQINLFQPVFFARMIKVKPTIKKIMLHKYMAVHVIQNHVSPILKVKKKKEPVNRTAKRRSVTEENFPVKNFSVRIRMKFIIAQIKAASVMR